MPFFKLKYFLITLCIPLTALGQWCAPGTTGGATGWNWGVDSVNIKGIINTSAIEEGYIDYSGTTDTAVLSVGEIVTIGLGLAGTYRYALWIDWNQDFDFDDGDELIGRIDNGWGVPVGDTIMSFTVPVTAVPGYTKMRIYAGDHSAVCPCDPGPGGCLPTGWNGDFEDYMLEISGDPMRLAAYQTLQTDARTIQSRPLTEIVGLQIKTINSYQPLHVNQVTFSVNGTTDAADIASATLWFTGQQEFFSKQPTSLGTISNPNGNMVFDFPNEQLSINGSDNFFWLTYTVAPDATIGNILDASVESFQYDSGGINKLITVSENPSGSITIIDDPEPYKSLYTYQFIYKDSMLNHWGYNYKKINRNPHTWNEGSATLSDNFGNLLFYTDGINIYNAAHEIIQNGDSLMGGYCAPSGSQIESGILFPMANSSTLYYAFYMDCSESANVDLYYSIIDISQDGGLGAVVSKDNFLLDDISEIIDAVEHCNGEDVWVAVQQPGNTKIYMYLASSGGVVNPPVIYDPGWGTIGFNHTKFSPDGSKFAVNKSAGQIHIFEFDNSSGTLSPYFNLVGVTGNFAFSPDGSKMYFSEPGTLGGDPHKVYQLNLAEPNVPGILASKTYVGDMYQTYNSGPQLAPWGELFWGNNIFENPNDSVPDLIIKQGLFNGDEMPDFVESYFLTSLAEAVGLKEMMDSFSFVCSGEAMQFIPDTSYTKLDSINWDFGDGTQSVLLNPEHIYSSIDTFMVTAVLYSKCRTDTLSAEVIVLEDSLSKNYTLCIEGSGVEIGMNDTNITNFSWDINTGLSDTSISNPIASPSSSTIYTLSYDIGNCPLIMINNVNVGYPEITVSYDQNAISKPPLLLNLNALTNEDGTYLWSTGDTTANIIITDTGVYIVTFTTGTGCQASDTVSIFYLSELTVFVPNAFSPDEDGLNDELKVSLSGTADLAEVVLSIYNKRGEKVFEQTVNPSSNIPLQWDGKENGALPASGIYVWNLQLIYNNGRPADGIKGNVTMTY